MNLKQLNKKGKVETDIVAQVALDRQESSDTAGQFQDDKEDLLSYKAIQKPGGVAFKFEDGRNESVLEFVSEYFPVLYEDMMKGDKKNEYFMAIGQKVNKSDEDLGVTILVKDMNERKSSAKVFDEYLNEFEDVFDYDTVGETSGDNDSDLEWASKFGELYAY